MYFEETKPCEICGANIRLACRVAIGGPVSRNVIRPCPNSGNPDHFEAERLSRAIEATERTVADKRELTRNPAYPRSFRDELSRELDDLSSRLPRDRERLADLRTSISETSRNRRGG